MTHVVDTPLADPAAEALAQRVAAIMRQAAPLVTDSVLTRAEAMAYVKHDSISAFHGWCRRWRVRPRERGRYSRHQLDLALAREAGAARIPSSIRRHQAAA